MTLRERVHAEAIRIELPALATRLQEILGQKLTAFAVGLNDPRLIGKYARGDVRPSSETETRLRELYVITQVLMSKETPEAVRAWMLGAHPLLEDRAPIELLHEEDAGPVDRMATAEAHRSFRTVVHAAEGFVR